MDNVSQKQESEKLQALENKLTPPPHGDISAVLNGISNGAMVLGLPAIIYHESKATGEAAKGSKTAFFITIAGSAIGAWFGCIEAKRTREYRNGIIDEISKLRLDVDVNSATVKKWVDKDGQCGEVAKTDITASR